MLKLYERLCEICRLQQEHGFILTGFYLAVEEVKIIQNVLTPDDPNIGAIGRFRGVPVFTQPREQNVGEIESVGSVQYSFVRIACMDLGDPAD